MFISKKRFTALEKRIADLEVQVQSQQKIESHFTIDEKQICLAVKGCKHSSMIDVNADCIGLQVQ